MDYICIHIYGQGCYRRKLGSQKNMLICVAINRYASFLPLLYTYYLKEFAEIFSRLRFFCFLLGYYNSYDNGISLVKIPNMKNMSTLCMDSCVRIPLLYFRYTESSTIVLESVTLEN